MSDSTNDTPVPEQPSAAVPESATATPAATTTPLPVQPAAAAPAPAYAPAAADRHAHNVRIGIIIGSIALAFVLAVGIFGFGVAVGSHVGGGRAGFAAQSRMMGAPQGQQFDGRGQRGMRGPGGPQGGWDEQGQQQGGQQYQLPPNQQTPPSQ